MKRAPNRVTIEELVRLTKHKNDLEIARRALKVEALPESWKQHIRKMLG